MNFYLPDFFYKFKLNNEIVDLMQKKPEYFYEGAKIGAIYGSFPHAIWNGGRKCLGFTDFDNIESTINKFNDRGIPLRFTFTNCLIEENHLQDTYCNLIMELAHNGKNGVIVNSKLLEEYLREKYPNYHYILSTTKCERNIGVINQYCKEYDMVVSDYRDNRDFDFLGQIKDKSKIELLINAYCSPNCKMRKEHYEYLSSDQLNFRRVSPMDKVFSCPTYNRGFYEALEFDTVIKNNELYSTYANLGFENFKIEGRSSSTYDVIESYVYYLVKPEYRDIVRLHLLKRCAN